ncbi:hypothetical protein MMC2321_01934 [Chitinophaga sp. MM2321]
MRNESSRQLIKQVEERQKQSFLFNIQIEGLIISGSVKQLIINHLSHNHAFGLSTEDQNNVVYFIPSCSCAVWCDNGAVTLNIFQDNKQFQDCVKLALVAHQTFLGGRQISGHERYKEICKQLNDLK